MKLAAALGSALVASSLAAQNPPPRPPMASDTPPAYEPGMMDPRERMQRERMEMRERMLRQEVEMRFNELIRTQLELNDQQMRQLQTAMRANQDRRRGLMQREMDTRRAMASQMQPGIAADSDSLNRLLEQASRLRIERAQSDDQFMRDLGFLTPVQRTRFVFLTQRFEERLQQIRQGRMGPDGPGGPDGRMRPDGPEGQGGRVRPDGPGAQPGQRQPMRPRQPRP